MPMRQEVLRPIDSLFQLEGFVQLGSNSDVREFMYPGIGRIIDAPSSYIVKHNDLIAVQITATHPAWLHSGLNYDDDYIRMTSSFKRHKADLGIMAGVFVPNQKKAGQMATMAGTSTPSTVNHMVMDNIPIHYYGEAIESKKPGQSGYKTFLTEIINREEIDVTCLSPFEYEIEVKRNLAEDQWFYIPISNAKGMSNTTWGKIGNESTLPNGATAGLIKIRSEATLDAKTGTYLVSGDQLKAVTQSSSVLYRQSASVNGQSAPGWFNSVETTTLNSLPQYTTLKEMVENETEWYACGYKSGCTTVGTGIFVRNNNQPCALSYGKAGAGLSTKKIVSQITSIFKTAKLGDLLDFGDEYFEIVAKAGFEADLLPDGIVIPFCAAELEYAAHKDGPAGSYRMPSEPDYNYTYMYHNTLMPASITPTYIPSALRQHCYSPRLNFNTATMVSMLQIYDLNDDVNMTLKAHPSWIQVVQNNSVTTSTDNYVPKKISDDHSLNYGSINDPVREFDRDQFGFHIGKEANITGSQATGYRWSGGAIINWSNPSINPTIGQDATNSLKTHSVLTGGMIMAFVGFLPKGTAEGKYLWKPFESVETSADCLSIVNLEYLPTAMQAKLKPDTTMAPYLGTNIITAEGPNIEWFAEQRRDTAGDYTFWQPMKNVQITTLDTTKITDTILIALSQDTVPLVGYPITDKPMRMDIDDWTGDSACDVGDLAMTTPFYDEELKQWVVIAASAQMQKFYRLKVEVNSVDGESENDPKEHVGRYVTRFVEVIDSKELFDTPYGRLIDVYGLCYTKDIHYLDGEEDHHLVLYGRTEYEPSAKVQGSNLVVGTCRTYMEWDSNKDTISRVRISDVLPEDFQITDDINWPRSVAVMYPYIYILGYHYEVAPTNPIVDPLVGSTAQITGEGWQMALWKVDINSGIVNDVIQLTDTASYRFTYGIPALNKEATRLYKGDYNTLGAVRRYAFGPDQHNKLPVSTTLPKVSTGYEFPSLSGICHVSGQLMAFSNYHEKLVLINPLTGAVETLGTNVFPFSYPFNSSIASNGDLVSAVALFGGRHFYSVNPFFHVCIGDGLPPNSYGTGIDVTDAANGTKLLRKCRLKNNLLRDRLSNVELIVPDPTELPGSSMLHLSWTGRPADKVKTLKLNDHPEGRTSIDPSGYVTFYLHVEPAEPIEKTFILYLNAKFSRTTEFFGYRLRIGEVE